MSKRPAWCVSTLVCDHQQITTLILPADVLTKKAWKAHLRGELTFGNDPNTEIVSTGGDWRTLVGAGVAEMVRRTGLRICFACIEAYANNEGFQDETIRREAHEILYALAKAHVADVEQTTEDEKQAIVARWQELCGLVTEAGISEAEKERRARAADEFATASLHHMQAFAEYAERRLRGDYPPGSVATEADRMMIFDRIMRPYQRRHN